VQTSKVEQIPELRAVVTASGEIRAKEFVDIQAEVAAVIVDLPVEEGDDVKVGAPYVEGGKVSATVKAHGRGKKVKIVKFKRRKHHLKRQGHRQWYTELEITGISAG